MAERGSAEPSPTSCRRADLCPLPAGSLRLHPLSPWTALPPRKTSPPQVLPPVCAGLDMEPVALCWLEHALPLSHTQLPPCLYSNLGEADTVFILQTQKQGQGAGRFSRGHTAKKAKMGTRHLDPFLLAQAPPSKEVPTAKFEGGFKTDHTPPNSLIWSSTVHPLFQARKLSFPEASCGLYSSHSSQT